MSPSLASNEFPRKDSGTESINLLRSRLFTSVLLFLIAQISISPAKLVVNSAIILPDLHEIVLNLNNQSVRKSKSVKQ